MEKKKIESVNIGGTHNIINGMLLQQDLGVCMTWCLCVACVECGVTRLVYTSTYNVVFGGQEIREGDESLPYLPLHKVEQVIAIEYSEALWNFFNGIFSFAYAKTLL